MKAAFAALRTSAKTRNIPFLLTFEEFERFAVRTKLLKGRGVTKLGWHVDRIDSNGPYSIDNIQVLTNSENASKEALRRKWAAKRDLLNEAGFVTTAFYMPRKEEEPPEVTRIVKFEFSQDENGNWQRVGWIEKHGTKTPEPDEEDCPF